MLFIRGANGRTLLKAILPYLLGLLAVVAVLIFYFQVTGRVVMRGRAETEARAVLLAEELTDLSMDSSFAEMFFVPSTSDGILFRTLRPEFISLCGLKEFTVAEPLGEDFIFDPFDGDPLALSVIGEGEPGLQHGNSLGTGEVIVFYPARTGAVMSLARAVLNESSIGWYDEYRYNFFILSIAVIMLIIIPGLLLRLADLRRRIEVREYTGSEAGCAALAQGGPEQWGSYPATLFQGSSAPAMLRLDHSGRILDLNDSAVLLLGLSRETLSGAHFNRLPLVMLRDGDTVRRIIDIEDLAHGPKTLVVEDGAGGQTDVNLTTAEDGDGGLILMGFRSRPGTEQEDAEAGTQTEPGQGRILTAEELSALLELAETGRGSTPETPDGRRRFELIAGILTGEPGDDVDLQGSDETGIQLSTELESIASALNDVLPERASIQVETPGLLPSIDCSRQELTQLIKNLVFYSLQSVPGPVRIRLTARDVPSPSSDPVFSARCGTLYHRSVSLSFTDGSRMPLRLKEALLDPETDSSGIQRDFGSHISTAASVISGLECDPVLTEGTMGTTLHMIFACDDAGLYDQAGEIGAAPGDGRVIKVAFCDASRVVRDGVTAALGAFGITVSGAPDVGLLLDTLTDENIDGVVLDSSVLEKPAGKSVEEVRKRWPQAVILVTARTSELPELKSSDGLSGIPMIRKPYSPHEIMEILGRGVSRRG